MCYAKREFGKWSGKKILDATMLAGHYSGTAVFNDLEAKLGKSPNLIIYVHDGIVLYDRDDREFAKANMAKKSFYFWANRDKANGNLTIHVRREYHEDFDDWHSGYTEYAYEDGFLINACNEATEIIPPVLVGDWQRILARPYNTLPNSVQFKEGLDGPIEGLPVSGVFARQERHHDYNGNVMILRNNGGRTYWLTYPHQYMDAMWDQPFFMADAKHTFFFHREPESRCEKIPVKEGEMDPSSHQSKATLLQEGFYYHPRHYTVRSDRYTVQAHEHPYGCLMLSELNRAGLEGLYQSRVKNDHPAFELRRQQKQRRYFNPEYGPVSRYINTRDLPMDEFDFGYFGAYQQYNWEIFFHVPALIAQQLKNSGEFADALYWIQLIFDPTNRDNLPGTKRYWMVKPFLADLSEQSIHNLMHLLGANGLSPERERQREQLKAQIETWRDRPFEPHAIAEMRHRAYMLWVVAEYVDILIEWGDSLFRQFSHESINEATNLYVLAAEILGDRPQTLDRPHKDKSSSFNDIRTGLDEFSNALVDLENEIPAVDPVICCQGDTTDQSYQLPNLFFCIPENPRLKEVWDRVADRLFKIRHCMDIDGKVRELPLFQPPIDPAMLVRARAMGLDIGEVLSGLSAPEPHYRFGHLLQKANEYAGELKALGGQLLSALEKKDSEELGQIRQLHEQNLLKATRNLKKLQFEEAKENRSILENSKKLIELRKAEYEGREYMNERELEARSLTLDSDRYMRMEKETMLLGKLFGLIPQFHAGPFPDVETGGKTLAQIADMVATSFGVTGALQRNDASAASTIAGYDRRKEDWDFQVKTAAEELVQIDRQLLASDIRIALAEKELENHDLQAEQSREIYDYAKSKFTNLKLYGWMSGQISKLNYQAYKLAHDMALAAQRAMKKELGENPDIITFDHWDSGKKGLLAGERLSLQLKQLDEAYFKADKRQYELSKNISLKLLDPQALVNLIRHGHCRVQLTESLFNMDFAGKGVTNIRLKSVALSMPCVTGPHVSTNVKIRIGGDEMITSTALNDSGVFEANFSQPKYLPFEYLEIGEATECTLLLDGNSAFDLTTISDLVLHVNYLAEDDQSTESGIDGNTNTPVNHGYFLMSWRYDFPDLWQRWSAQLDTVGTVQSLRGLSDFQTIKANLTEQGRVQLPYRYLNSHTLEDNPLADFFAIKDSKVFSEPSNSDDPSSFASPPDDIWLLYQLKPKN